MPGITSKLPRAVPLTTAYKQALEGAVKLQKPRLNLGPDFDLLVSIIYYLSRLNPRFCLPRDRVAKVMGKRDRHYVGHLIAIIVRENLISLVKPANWATHEAAEYELGSAFAVLNVVDDLATKLTPAGETIEAHRQATTNQSLEERKAFLRRQGELLKAKEAEEQQAQKQQLEGNLLELNDVVDDDVPKVLH